jgi:hypothetical protein
MRYTAPATGSDTTFTVVASAGGKTGTADVAFKGPEQLAEFKIGAGGTFNVPAGVTTLYPPS